MTLRWSGNRSGAQYEPALAGRSESQHTADALLDRMLHGGESFWLVVYPLFSRHDLTRDQLREIVTRALQQAEGRYKTVLALFNMPPADYHRFLNFLRKHECLVPFQPFRPRRSVRAGGKPPQR